MPPVCAHSRVPCHLGKTDRAPCACVYNRQGAMPPVCTHNRASCHLGTTDRAPCHLCVHTAGRHAIWVQLTGRHVSVCMPPVCAHSRVHTQDDTLCTQMTQGVICVHKLTDNRFPLAPNCSASSHSVSAPLVQVLRIGDRHQSPWKFPISAQSC